MNETIGSRISRLRKAKKMTVDELAERIGKNRATIYRYERNEIENAPYNILVPIAEALDTTPTYLLGFEENETVDVVNKNLSNNNKDAILEISNELAISMDDLKKWNEEVGETHFTDEEIDELINFAKYIISKRKEK